MKYLLSAYTLFFLATSSILAQKEHEPDFSQIDSFLLSIDKIELVELKPFCKSVLRLDENSNQYQMREVCYLLSILLYDEQKNAYDFDAQSLVNKKTIDKEDYSILFSIFLDSNKDHSHSMCYEPRHGILFFNNKMDTLGFIEICFQCSRIKKTEGILGFDYITHHNYTDLRKLFTRYGYKIQEF